MALPAAARPGTPPRQPAGGRLGAADRRVRGPRIAPGPRTVARGQHDAGHVRGHPAATPSRSACAAMLAPPARRAVGVSRPARRPVRPGRHPGRRRALQRRPGPGAAGRRRLRGGRRLRAAGITVGVVTQPVRHRAGPAHPAAGRRRQPPGRASCSARSTPGRSARTAPEDGCGCRKPAPGMVSAAADALGVAPHEVVVVGDIGADVGAARAAGARGVLVPTPSHAGRGDARGAPMSRRPGRRRGPVLGGASGRVGVSTHAGRSHPRRPAGQRRRRAARRAGRPRGGRAAATG